MIPEHEVAEFAQEYKKANEVVLQKLEKSKAQIEVTLQKLVQKQGECEHLKKQLAEYEGRVAGLERTAQYDYDNFWEIPRLIVGAVCIVCFGMGLVLWQKSDKLQEIGVLKEFVGMYLFLCIFGAVACIFAFWVANCKQHTIDYLQDLQASKKPPQT